MKTESVFIPYLGKNDFQLWWSKPKHYTYGIFDYNSNFVISCIFLKDKAIKEVRQNSKVNSVNFFSRQNGDVFINDKESFFSYFERLPIGFSELTKNYELNEFTFTNFKFPADYKVNSLYELDDEDNNKIIIQLF